MVLNVLNAEGAVVRQFAFKKIDRASYAQHRAVSKQAMAMGGGSGEGRLRSRGSSWCGRRRQSPSTRSARAPAVVIALGQELLSEADAGLAVTRDPR